MQILTMAIQFHWERLTQPGVIIGILIMIVGLIVNFTAKSITASIAKRKKANTQVEKNDMTYLAIKYVGIGLTLVGVLVAIVTMQY